MIKKPSFKKANKKKDNGQKQTELDKKLVYSLSKSQIPSFRQLKYLKRFLSFRELWLIRLSLTVITVSIIIIGVNFYLTNLQVLPVAGGEYTEALVGTPKYINPLYASASDVDTDLSSLVYSSLLKHDNNGNLINDLTVDYKVSENNKAYSFTIRNDAYWHNGNQVTVDDIIFTFKAIQDSEYKSSLRTSFSGVEIEKENENTVRFILTEPYAAFLELLTFGILPRELWYQVPPETATLTELNLKPVGSGPYKFKKLSKDTAGNIRDYYLEKNNEYYNQSAYIESLVFKFFPNFEEAVMALNDNLVEGVSYLPKELKKDIVSQSTVQFHDLNLPQLSALFFNQQANDVLAEKNVRYALAYAINIDKIISDILNNEARTIHSPILPDSFAYNQEVKQYNYNIEEASKLLDEAGWKYFTITEEEIEKSGQVEEGENEKVKEFAQTVTTLGAGQWRRQEDKFLIIKLTTVDIGENKQILDTIKVDWEKVGVKVVVEIVEPSLMQQEIIKPRAFEALFYGLVVGADPDMYPLWHSSQIGEAGLNIADYDNNEVDKLLEDARLSSDNEVRREKYLKFQEYLAEDVPAIFLYSPTYTYLQSKKLKGFNVGTIVTPHDRLANITEWYLKTGKKLIWQ